MPEIALKVSTGHIKHTSNLPTRKNICACKARKKIINMLGNLGLLKIVRFTGIILKGPFKLFVGSYFNFEHVRRIRHPSSTSRKKRVLEEEEKNWSLGQNCSWGGGFTKLFREDPSYPYLSIQTI